MVWTKLDDNFADDDDVWALSDKAFRLHVSALIYCNRLLTDGFVGAGKVSKLVPFRRPMDVAAELVNAGRWALEEQGYRIVNFLRYNPSKAEVAEKRAQAAERQRKWRESRASNGVSNAVTDGVTNGVSNAAPTRPDPTRPSEVQERTSLALAPPPQNGTKSKRPRPPDPIFDALVEVCGYGTITDAERGRLNVAARQLKAVDATPDEIKYRATVYATKWPDMELTPTAIAANWSSLADFPSPVRRAR